PVGDVQRVARREIDDEHRDVAGRRLPRHREVGLVLPRSLRLGLLAGRRELGAKLVALARTLVEARERLTRGDGLDSARAGADRGFGEDDERPDLGSRADVRAAAELPREAV